jgi:hypothetical protein
MSYVIAIFKALRGLIFVIAAIFFYENVAETCEREL